MIVDDSAAIPSPWLHSRVVCIPKETGGFRPLTVAAIMWRLGASTMTRQLRLWIDTWAPHELIGGLAGRCPDDLHMLVKADMHECLQEGYTMIGCKIDAEKCFGNVSPLQAEDLWARLRTPKAVTDLIRVFYKELQRWIEVDRCVAAKSFSPNGSILQGCPFSPPLFAGLMACWVRHVIRRAAGTKAGVCVDDRVTWTITCNPVEWFTDILAKTAVIDAAMHMSVSQGKIECAASTVEARQALEAHFGVTTTYDGVEILGIGYDFKAGSEIQLKSKT